jgi:hypothetical protein
MSGRRAIRGLPLFGIAAAGVVLGHTLSYLISIPSATLRAQFLAATGHGAWLLIVKLAVATCAAGVATLFSRHLARPGGTSAGGVAAYTGILVRLVAIQIVGFTAMEIAERAVVGTPVGPMFVHSLLYVGLAVQFLVACAGSLAILWLCRAARSVAEAIRSSRLHVPATPAASHPTLAPVLAPVLLFRVVRAIRAPPSS